MLSTAKGFFSLIVEPTVKEFTNTPNDIRRGLLAILVLNHMVDHFAQENEVATNRKIMNERVKAIRDDILEECPDFQFIWDVADTTKHAKLSINKNPRMVSSSSQISRTPGIFEAPFGEGAFAGAIEVFAVLEDGTKKSLLPVVKTVFQTLHSKLQ